MYTTGERLEMQDKEIEELRKDLEAANAVIKQKDAEINILSSMLDSRNTEIIGYLKVIELLSKKVSKE